MFLGRVVEPGDSQWSPEDRDVVDMYLAEQRARNSCGHYLWERLEDVEGLELGYRVCSLCAELGPYEQKIREQNRSRQEDEYGLTLGWFPPRDSGDGD